MSKIKAPDELIPYVHYNPEDYEGVSVPTYEEPGYTVPSEPLVWNPNLPKEERPEQPSRPTISEEIIKHVASKPAQSKSSPEKSISDKQLDAITALEVAQEDVANRQAPVSTPVQAAPVKRDTIAEYMDMLKQLKGDEEKALDEGKEELRKGRRNDAIANTIANAFSALGTMYGGKIDPKSMYSGFIGTNAEKDYEDLLRGLQQKKTDLSNDLTSQSRLQGIRKSDSDFDSVEAFRSPSTEVSSLYRDMFRKNNPQVPISDDVSAEQVQALLRQMGKSGEMSEYQKAFLEIQKKRIDQADQRIDQQKDRESRMWSQFDHNKTERDELPQKQQEQIANNLKTIDELRRIEENPMLEEFAGPITQRIHQAQRFIGVDNAKASALQAQAVSMAANYIKSISGVAVSEQEFARLSQALPNLLDKPETVRAVIKDIRTRLNRENDIMLDVFSKTKNVEPFRNMQVTPDNSKYEGDTRIDNFMKKNNIKNRNEAIGILKNRGLIK